MATSAQDGQWRALLRRPGYPGFVLTVSASRMVSAMFNTAGVLLVLDRTGSTALAGATTAAAVLPGALAGPWLGAWLDVVHRRRLLVVADQLISVVALGLMLALTGHAPDWTVAAAAVLLGITRPFSTGSFVSALSALAGPELLDRASAIEATSMNLSIVVGPALAAALAGTIGAGRVVALQAALTVLIAVAIAVNPSFEARTRDAGGSVAEAMRAGRRALLGNRLLRDVSAATLLANLSWGLMIVVFPLYAAGALHSGRSGGGYLWAGLAVGSIIGTFLLVGAPSRRRIGWSCAAVGLSALLWLLADSLAAGIALVTLTGITEGPFYSGSIALRQRLAPDVARAQVLNTLASMSMVAGAAGSLLGGVIADPSATFVAFAALNVAGALIVGRQWRLK